MATSQYLELSHFNFFCTIRKGCVWVCKYISFDPRRIELIFNQLDNIFHFVPYPSLFLSKSVQFRLFFSNLFPLLTEVDTSWIRILVKDIKNSNQNVSTQIFIGFYVIQGELFFVVRTVYVIIWWRSKLKNIVTIISAVWRLYF